MIKLILTLVQASKSRSMEEKSSSLAQKHLRFKITTLFFIYAIFNNIRSHFSLLLPQLRKMYL